MLKIIMLAIYILLISTCVLSTQQMFEKDIIKTSKGDLEITFVGHGTLMFKFAGKIIHVDPVSREADYTILPLADLILITHEHGDHLDLEAIKLLKTNNTKIILTEICAQRNANGLVMKNGDVQKVMGLKIEAIPAIFRNTAVRRTGFPACGAIWPRQPSPLRG